MKNCPYCAEEIQDAAIVCKHCGRDLATGLPPSQARPPSPGVAALLSLLIPGAGQIYAGRVGAGLAWLVFVVLGYMALVLPGLVLHVICVLTAYSAATPMRPAPGTSPSVPLPVVPPRDPNSTPAAASGSGAKWIIGGVLVAAIVAIAVFDRRELPPATPTTLTDAHRAAVAAGMKAKAYIPPTTIALSGGAVTATYVIDNDLAIPPRRLAEDRLAVIRAALDPFGFESYVVEVRGTPGAPQKAWGTARVVGMQPVEWHPQ